MTLLSLLETKWELKRIYLKRNNSFNLSFLLPSFHTGKGYIPLESTSDKNSEPQIDTVKEVCSIYETLLMWR